MTLYLADAIVTGTRDEPLSMLIEDGDSLVFPGESVEHLKQPIELPDSAAALRMLFLYKVKRKKEESDDEDEKKPDEESASESEQDEEEESDHDEEVVDDDDDTS